MIEFGFEFKEFKGMFFDRTAVINAVDKAKRQVLSKAGAFVRRTAKGLIRSRKSVSKPFRPPTSWTGLLKQFIFFGYDASTGSVVIGPVKLNRKGEVPNLLEFGGTVKSRRFRRFRAQAGRDRRGRYTQGDIVEIAEGTSMTYQPRPYMGPALAENVTKLPPLWAGSVRGG